MLFNDVENKLSNLLKLVKNFINKSVTKLSYKYTIMFQCWFEVFIFPKKLTA